MDSKTIKEIVDIAEPLATIIAILVGGFWSYMLFVRNRQKYPRAKISHQIAHKKISDEKVLLHVSTKISNIGNVLLSIISGRTWVQQVIPSQEKVLDSIPRGETEINWPSIGDKITKWEEGKFEIEPGEDDQICYDFVIDADVQTVKVYSHFENVKKRGRDLGWSWTTIYDLKEKEMSQNRKED
jgi:hypothetical protein